VFSKLQVVSQEAFISMLQKVHTIVSSVKFDHLKARYRWSDKSFTDLLKVLRKMLPKENTLLKNNYEAKKILCPMGMEYQKYMHALMIA